jgi:hypothetical protein
MVRFADDPMKIRRSNSNSLSVLVPLRLFTQNVQMSLTCFILRMCESELPTPSMFGQSAQRTCRPCRSKPRRLLPT